jgi:hypothetical protein
VECLRFSTKSKNANTPPEWAGTLLIGSFALRKQSPPQVTSVELAPQKGARTSPELCYDTQEQKIQSDEENP